MEELSTPLLDPEAASEQGLSRVERRKSSSSISEEELEGESGGETSERCAKLEIVSSINIITAASLGHGVRRWRECPVGTRYPHFHCTPLAFHLLHRACASEAYNRIISTAQAQGVQTAIDEAFDALDVTETGNLNRHDIVLFMRAAAGHTKLDKHDVNGSVVEAAVDALIHDAGGGDGESIIISRSQFRDIFERHPDMMSAFEDLEAAQNRRKNAIQIMTKGGDGEAGAEEEDEDEENEQVWMHEAVTHWKNKWITALWIAIYIAGNAFMFAYKATEYARHEEAQAVFGNCIIVARGCAHCLNLNALLVLLAMCKHFLTLMRKTPLRFCFPFDAIQEAHIMIGIVFGLLAASHTAAHICDFHRLGNADSDDIYALFRFDLPEGYSARWGWALSTRAGITGIIMVVCLIVSYSFAFNRRKRFNRFWYTHHLLLVMLICLCVHGTQNLLEPYKSLYFVIGPLVLYAIPRIWRETPLSSLEVVKVEVKRGDVVQLRLKKPWYYKGYVEAGMYGVLNVPEVSRTEWHPFTLTSAPPEDYIEFHFRRVGKWTGKVHDLLESRIANPPTVRVEGPIGASSQGFGDYAVIVLVGAGIGITPSEFPVSSARTVPPKNFALT